MAFHEMKIRRYIALFFVLILLVGVTMVSYSYISATLIQLPFGAEEIDSVTRARLVEQYGKRPLYFEKNEGQQPSEVKFMASESGYRLYFTDDEVVYTYVYFEDGDLERIENHRTKDRPDIRSRKTVFRQQFVDHNQRSFPSGKDLRHTYFNYYKGNDRSKWKNAIPTYGRIEYENIYRGVDLVYYGTKAALKYEYVVRPRVDYRIIRSRYELPEGGFLRIDEKGNLVVNSVSSELVEQKPYVYQVVNGEEVEIKASFVLYDDFSYGFDVGEYDVSIPLVIDPSLQYFTLIGGSAGDRFWDVTVDSTGRVYGCGHSLSADYPTTGGAYDTTYGGFDELGWYGDQILSQFNASLTTLNWSTYIGTADDEFCAKVVVDSSDNVIIGGESYESTFPTTAGAYDETKNSNSSNADVTFSKFNSSGSLLYSSFLGSANAGGHTQGLSITGDDELILSGATWATGLPTVNAYDSSHSQSGPSWNADHYIIKFDSDLTTVLFGTYFGENGTGTWGYDQVIDSSENVYIVGYLVGSDFETKNAPQTATGGGEDAFIFKLAAAGNALTYSTYHGGSGNERANSVFVDASGKAFVSGVSASSDMPTANAYDATLSGSTDSFFFQLSADGTTRDFSTYLGGSGDENGGETEIEVDAGGNIYVIGTTGSSDFPTVNAPYPSKSLATEVYFTQFNSDASSLLYGSHTRVICYNTLIGSFLSGNQIYVAGECTSGSTYVPAVGSYNLVNSGGYDAYLLSFVIDNTPPDTPISLGAANLVDGSEVNSHELTFTFTTDDDDATDSTIKYHIQIDDTSTFASPVIDFTSALTAEGAQSFTVGQVAGGGTYTVGSAGQTLSASSFYWRVRSLDNEDGQSLYATANGGAVAFSVNLSPDVPTGLGPAAFVDGSSGSNREPILQFTLNDSDAGDTVGYQVQIDNDSDFSSLVINYTSAFAAQGAASFTVGQDAGSGMYHAGAAQSLSPGEYYWRVLAVDWNSAASAYATANAGGMAFRIVGSSGSQSSGRAASSSSTSSTSTSGSAIPSTPESSENAIPADSASVVIYSVDDPGSDPVPEHDYSLIEEVRFAQILSEWFFSAVPTSDLVEDDTGRSVLRLNLTDDDHLSYQHFFSEINYDDGVDIQLCLGVRSLNSNPTALYCDEVRLDDYDADLLDGLLDSELQYYAPHGIEYEGVVYLNVGDETFSESVNLPIFTPIIHFDFPDAFVSSTGNIVVGDDDLLYLRSSLSAVEIQVNGEVVVLEPTQVYDAAVDVPLPVLGSAPVNVFAYNILELLGSEEGEFCLLDECVRVVKEGRLDVGIGTLSIGLTDRVLNIASIVGHVPESEVDDLSFGVSSELVKPRKVGSLLFFVGSVVDQFVQFELKKRESETDEFKPFITEPVRVPKLRLQANYEPPQLNLTSVPVFQYVPPVVRKVKEVISSIANVVVSGKVLERKVLHEEIKRKKIKMKEEREKFDSLKLSSFEETVGALERAELITADELIQDDVKSNEIEQESTSLGYDSGDLFEKTEEERLESDLERRKKEEENRLKEEEKRLKMLQDEQNQAEKERQKELESMEKARRDDVERLGKEEERGQENPEGLEKGRLNELEKVEKVRRDEEESFRKEQETRSQEKQVQSKSGRKGLLDEVFDLFR